MTRDFSTPIIIPLSKTKIMLIFAGLIFFGFCGVYAAGKLADRKPGLVIDDEGIIDNSSAIAAGRIRWGNMMGFTVTTIQGTKILNILVRSPQSYLEGKGRLARLA